MSVSAVPEGRSASGAPALFLEALVGIAAAYLSRLQHRAAQHTSTDNHRRASNHNNGAGQATRSRTEAAPAAVTSVQRFVLEALKAVQDVLSPAFSKPSGQSTEAVDSHNADPADVHRAAEQQTSLQSTIIASGVAPAAVVDDASAFHTAADHSTTADGAISQSNSVEDAGGVVAQLPPHDMLTASSSNPLAAAAAAHSLSERPGGMLPAHLDRDMQLEAGASDITQNLSRSIPMTAPIHGDVNTLASLADSIAAAAPGASAAAVSAARQVLVEHLDQLKQQQQQIQEQLQQVSAARHRHGLAALHGQQLQISWDTMLKPLAAAELAAGHDMDPACHNQQLEYEADLHLSISSFNKGGILVDNTDLGHVCDSAAEQQMLENVLQALDESCSLRAGLQDPCDPYLFAADRRLAAAADVLRSCDVQEGLCDSSRAPATEVITASMYF